MRLKSLDKDSFGKLIGLTGILFGIWLRLLPAALAEFPINDGGMFYAMLEGLIGNDFRLPYSITYNGLSLPFAYPPLAFYLGGWLSAFFQIPLLDLLRWFPAAGTALTVIAFHSLSRTMMKSEMEAGLATLVFAFTPRALTWMVMGGGLTRSLGELFLILAVRSIYLAFTRKTLKHLLFSIIYSALVVLTHPEAIIHTILYALLIWAFLGRNTDGIKRALAIGLGVLVFTSPWWITILQRYGLGPILSAAQTGDQSWVVFIQIFLIPVSEEPYITMITALGFVGLFILLARRDYLIPCMFLLPFIIEPRNAQNVAIIPLGMLAAISLTSAVYPALAFREPGKNINTFQQRTILAASMVLFLLFLINAGYFVTQISKNHLSGSTLAAYDWIQQNTPTGSRFMLITGETENFCDNIQEWFPVFTNRISVSTPQGREWTDGSNFAEYRDNLIYLQKCANSNIECVNDLARSMQVEYDYLYIQRKSISRLFCIPRGEASRGGSLMLSVEMDQASSYEKVYLTDEVAIYRVKP